MFSVETCRELLEEPLPPAWELSTLRQLRSSNPEHFSSVYSEIREYLTRTGDREGLRMLVLTFEPDEVERYLEYQRAAQLSRFRHLLALALQDLEVTEWSEFSALVQDQAKEWVLRADQVLIGLAWSRELQKLADYLSWYYKIPTHPRWHWLRRHRIRQTMYRSQSL